MKTGELGFYHLNGSRFFDHGEVEPRWYTSIDQLFCRECLEVYPHVAGVDLQIKGKLTDVPLTKPGGIYVGIIHREFVRQLGADLFQSLFHLGKVVDWKRGVLEDYWSFLGKTGCFHVRGGRHSNNFFCPKCGRRVYSPLGSKNEMHLMRAKLPIDPICHSNWNQLIVRGDVLKRVDWTRWRRKPYIVPLQIRDQPLDGIDEVF